LINFKIQIDDIRVQEWFKRTPKALDTAMQSIVRELGIRLTNKIKANKLTGNPLKVQTGRLRNSIHSDEVFSGNTYTTNVGTNVKYAAIHEYGFSGSQSIKTHSRTITQAFGKPIGSTTFSVSAHIRTVHMPMRSFARSALAEFTPQIKPIIENRIDALLLG